MWAISDQEAGKRIPKFRAHYGKHPASSSDLNQEDWLSSASAYHNCGNSEACFSVRQVQSHFGYVYIAAGNMPPSVGGQTYAISAQANALKIAL